MLKAIVKFFKDIVSSVVNTVSTVFGPGNGSDDWIWTVKNHTGTTGNDEIDEMFRRHMEDENIKAGQFSLMVNGVRTVSAAYTWGESGYQVTETNSLMRIASCSKAFTTSAILNLMASGKITGEEKVFDLLKDRFTSTITRDERVKQITVKHLVEHTGGWDYRSNPFRSSGDWVFHTKVIGRQVGLDRPPTKWEFGQFVLCNINLDFDPGTRPAEFFFIPTGKPTKPMDTYSNISYVLLGLFVEKISNGSFIDYLNSTVVGPAITDVKVGKTRKSEKLSNEVFYEDSTVGPDATLPPYDLKHAPAPYGGDGSLKEEMDAGGGLIISANSLASFINMNNVWLTNLTTGDPLAVSGMGARSNSRRDGSMPGTYAVATCFTDKTGLKPYDMVIIFNQRAKGGRLFNPTPPIDRLVNRLTAKVQDLF